MKKSFKDNRAAGLTVIIAVYISATVGAIFVYNLIAANYLIKIFIADICATVYVFIFSCVFKNASVYDPYWSVAPPVILTALCFSFDLTALSILLLVCVWAWSIRLTANWVYTFHGFSYEDWRYKMLRENSGKFYPFVNFTGIHLFPTLVVYGCILPAAASFLKATELSPSSLIGVAVCLLSVVLQAVSDIEMHVFRKKKTGGLIDTGLWRYARHPNYLGEIGMWWGVYLAVLFTRPDLWYLFIGALINTLMFLFISIPMADKRQSQKDGWKERKAQTHALLPFPIFLRK